MTKIYNHLCLCILFIPRFLLMNKNTSGILDNTQCIDKNITHYYMKYYILLHEIIHNTWKCYQWSRLGKIQRSDTQLSEYLLASRRSNWGTPETPPTSLLYGTNRRVWGCPHSDLDMLGDASVSHNKCSFLQSAQWLQKNLMNIKLELNPFTDLNYQDII